MAKKLTIFISVIILSIITIYFFTREKEKITNYPPKNQTIVAFGDSLIEGVGATPGADFISKIENDLGIKIINKGVSGDTTTSALSRIDAVSSLNPGVVIILLGGNDFLRRVPKEETFLNLEKIIEHFQNNESAVLLLGVRGGILFDDYDEYYKKLSEKYHTGYVSNVLENLLVNQKYMSDGIHPNDAGYTIIAERVAPILKKLLK